MSFTNIQFLFYFISVFHVHVRIDWTATKEKKKPITYVYTHTHLLPMKMHRLKTLESCTLYAYILAHTTMEKNSKNGFVQFPFEHIFLCLNVKYRKMHKYQLIDSDDFKFFDRIAHFFFVCLSGSIELNCAFNSNRRTISRKCNK